MNTNYFQSTVSIWWTTQYRLINANYIIFQFTNAYQLSIYNNIYYPICGDGIKTYFEQCDDALLNINNCFYCKLQCDPTDCLTCVQDICYQCRDSFYLNEESKCIYIEQQINQFQSHFQEQQTATCQDYNFNDYFFCKQQCDPTSCLTCVQDICYQCRDSFYLNEESKCIYIEQQTQLLQNQYQRQEQYQTSCQEKCDLCVEGKCLKCKLGWQLALGKCIDIVCGDSLVTKYFEECDDANTIPYDGCFQCKLECDINCSICIQGICSACNFGWYLNDLNSCYSQCGDGIVVSEYEQCDDGNDIQYDGCYNCEYQCHQACDICDNNVCQECHHGYYLNNTTQSKLCEPKCGDMIIVENEECDDGNNDVNDGCDQCQLTYTYTFCDLNTCDLCFENECIFCDFGFYPIDNQCQPKCGDNIFISEIEGCEDGNNIDGDGCTASCQIEEGYICYQSMCTKYEQPLIQLKKQMINQQQSRVTVKFNQQVKTQLMSNETFSLTLTNLDQSIYTSEMIIIQEVNSSLNNIEYQFLITFNQSCVHPKAQVNCDMNLTNAYGQSVGNNPQYIILDSPQILNEFQKTLTKLTADAGSYSINGIFSLSGIFLLTQNFGILLNCLELIQQISYLKYINFQFPENLESFFECFEKVQLQNFLDEYLSYLPINIKLEQNYSLKGKFEHYQVQRSIFNNLFSLFGMYLFSLSLSLICKIITQQLGKISERCIKLMNFFILKQYIILRNLIYKLSCTSEFAIYIFFNANAYEILFASFIQILDENSDLKGKFGSLCALIIVIIYLYIILDQFQKINRNFQKNTILCFGIKSNGSHWKFQTNNLALLQKIIFIQAITLCQDEGVIALMEIFIIQLGFIIFLIYHNQFKHIYDQIITKLLIFISSATMMFYSKNWRDLSYQQSVTFGWITIFCIVLAMTFQIIVSVIQLISGVKQWISKQVRLTNIKKEEKKRQMINQQMIGFFI